MDQMENLSKTEELVMGLSNTSVVDDATHVIKGKRTKRSRLLSANTITTTTTVITSSCSSASGGGGDDPGSLSISSTTTDQEEEDMANCLILLAQGGGSSGGGDYSDHDKQQDHNQHQQQHQKQQVDQDQGDGDHNKIEIKGRKLTELGTACGAGTTNKVGFYIYECKTCNRTFPSFQALGGHRASHKRPKIMTEEKKPPPPAPPAPPVPSSPPPSRLQVMGINYDHQQFESGGDGGQLQPHMMKRTPPINPISLQFGSAQKANNNSNGNNSIKTKIHECSICGSEFTSGQALGGHMRRHRASANSGAQAMSGTETISNVTVAVPYAATVAIEVQPRTILELDLNLPAPEEDLRDLPKFQFTATTQKPIMLSAAPALIDCHY